MCICVYVQMIDLLYFLLILAIFVVAYGVTTQIILYPNSDLNIRLVKDVLSYASWSIFGEFNIEEISGWYENYVCIIVTYAQNIPLLMIYCCVFIANEPLINLPQSLLCFLSTYLLMNPYIHKYVIYSFQPVQHKQPCYQ